ncbi:hypothetical protein D9619_013627 [Psilocybe cf. subviscida]|uniref:Uncharacterized protein n=1 Tax=Psilocybe cf. subviscida TaxID=2480587 RepID=A0A8H5BT41_9AGAR|nr:hypothetical protein D9619_013627 [Psilocybe cf. subviscida]
MTADKNCERAREVCYSAVAAGESLSRSRITTARSLTVWEDGHQQPACEPLQMSIDLRSATSTSTRLARPRAIFDAPLPNTLKILDGFAIVVGHFIDDGRWDVLVQFLSVSMSSPISSITAKTKGQRWRIYSSSWPLAFVSLWTITLLWPPDSTRTVRTMYAQKLRSGLTLSYASSLATSSRNGHEESHRRSVAHA